MPCLILISQSHCPYRHQHILPAVVCSTSLQALNYITATDGYNFFSQKMMSFQVYVFKGLGVGVRCPPLLAVVAVPPPPLSAVVAVPPHLFQACAVLFSRINPRDILLASDRQLTIEIEYGQHKTTTTRKRDFCLALHSIISQPFIYWYRSHSCGAHEYQLE